MRPHLLLIAALAAPLVAQKGDEKDPQGSVQTDPPASMQIPAAPVRTPDEARAAFTVEPGYRIELVAAEPLVQDPVSIRFDAAGRMWVVEMRGFMPDADGNGEQEAVGSIAVLEDSDGDGRMDRRATYADGLAMPRAVLPLGAGAALVLAPPQLLHLEDHDGDGVADTRTPIGIEFQNGFTDPEHAANSPTFGMDNWIYLARFDQRLRLRDGKWSVEPVEFGGQWGLSMDDSGGWYFNTNSDHLRGHFAPPEYGPRHPFLERPAFVNQQIGKSQVVWPNRVTPGVNRGYRDGTLREDGRLAAFTAVCGPCVYRGDLMPELRGDVFVVEPSAHVIRRDVLRVDGIVVTASNAYPDREFVMSTDERFRPVDLANGPDGALYVVDMYRGLIQHRNYLTSYLRRQVERRGLAAPIHMGRIWRIVPDRVEVARRWVVPDGRSPEELVALLRDPNGQVRDAAQRALVAAPARATTVLAALREIARVEVETAPRLHALWTLEGLGALDRSTVIHALRDPEPRVREHALRLAEGFLRVRSDAILLGILSGIAAGEADHRVLMQMAFTLGVAGTGDVMFRARAHAALVDVLSRGVDDACVRDAVISGLAGEEMLFVDRLGGDPRWATRSDGRAAALTRLAQCVCRSRSDGALRALFVRAADESAGWRRRALLDGVAAALPGRGAKKIPLRGRPEALDRLAASGDDAIAKLVARIDAAADYEVPVGPRELNPVERARFDLGASLYAVNCTQCHQPSGRGMEGLAPPLDGSEWVLGSEARLARIVLHGLTGPIEVAGRAYDFPTMPDHGKLSDAELAAVLTYVRRAWKNEAEPIDDSFVAMVRAAEKARSQPWTAAALLGIE